jgi:hypothetical protein
MKVTDKLLATAGPKGKYLVAHLNVDHVQDGCETVAAGVVGVVKGARAGTVMFVYPHPPGTKSKDKAFSDGQVRIIPWSNLTPIGRVG